MQPNVTLQKIVKLIDHKRKPQPSSLKFLLILLILSKNAFRLGFNLRIIPIAPLCLRVKPNLTVRN